MIINKDMSMENPRWVDGQKSILEQKSMSMEEAKDTSWEARLNKQFFGGVPIDEMGSNQIEESELQGFIRQEREAVEEKVRREFGEHSEAIYSHRREALLREIVDEVEYLINKNEPYGDDFALGKDDAFTKIRELIKNKI